MESRRKFLQTLTMASGAVFSVPFLTRFSSAQEAEASGALSGTQFGPYLQNPTDDGVSILWKTEQPGLSWVEVWPVNDPSSRTVVQDAEFGLRRLKTPKHRVTVKGLKPGETYAYKVFSRPKKKGADAIEPSAGSTEQDGTFTTLNPGKDSTSLFIVNDMHGRGDHYAGIFKTGRADEYDVIFHNGDIVNWISDEKTIYEKVLDPLKDTLSKVPFVFIRGNHEYRGGMALQVVDFFPPRNGQYYYLFRQGPVCFIVLDTGEDKADTRDELFGVTDWEAYFREEGKWLAQAVNSPEYKSAPYKVVLQHIPIMGRGGYTEKLIMEHFAPVFEKADVDIMIGAHTHRNSFAEAGQRGVGFPILVNDNKGYVTIKADAKRMLVEQFDPEGNLLKEVTIKPS